MEKMKKAKEYFYESLDTDLITKDPKTYRIAKGALIDKALEIAYLEGLIEITSDRLTNVEGYSFIDWCTSTNSGARLRLRELLK